MIAGMIGTIIGIIDLVSSAYAVADAAGGIYSTATGAGNKYDKAEDYAHDVTLLVVSMVSVRDAVSAVKQNLKLFKSAAQDLAGWTARPKTSDLANASKSAGLISSMDDFTDYAKGFLDEDALQYVREALGNDADDSAQLKKIAQLVEDGSKKVGKKLSKEEVKAGLDALWDDAGAEGALAAIERHFKWANRYTGYEAPAITTNAQGQLTNGIYTINAKKMMPHLDGTDGKSRFLYDVDAEKAVLDASAYADEFNLWETSTGNPADYKNKAKIYVENGPVGVTGSGELTNYINVYRTKTGTVHGCPGNP